MTTPEQLRAARERMSMTQGEAAALVHVARITWRTWETTDNGRPVNETAAHLFAELTGQSYPLPK